MKKCYWVDLNWINISTESRKPSSRINELAPLSFFPIMNEIYVDYDCENEQGCDIRIFGKIKLKNENTSKLGTNKIRQVLKARRE